MIGTLSRAAALWISMAVAHSHRDARIFASTDRCPAQRDPSRNAARTTWRIARAFRRAAWRRCNACRKICRASPRAAKARCAPSELRPNPRPSRQPTRKARVRAEPLRPRQSRAALPRQPRPPRARLRPPPKAASRDSQQAEQRAHCRDPQRVPRRLSEGLRRRAHRRCPGTAVPGKEQVESFGSLPEGRRCRERRCRAADGRRPPDAAAPRGPAAAPAAPHWCFGRCDRAKNCSCCGRHAAPTSARFAAASPPAAVGLSSAWRRGPPRSPRIAVAYCLIRYAIMPARHILV